MKRSGLYIFLIFFGCIASCNDQSEDVIEEIIVTINASDSETAENEGVDVGEFRVQLSRALSQTTEVSLTITGSASNGIDYEEIPNKLIIPAGEISTRIFVLALGDTISEGTENVEIALLTTDNEQIQIGTKNTASIKIIDVAVSRILKNIRSYMVNPNATNETVALFYNMKVLSQNNTIIGQHNAFSSFFNSNSSQSDMSKATGSDPGLLGSDFMFITDDKNDEDPANWFYRQELRIKTDVQQAYDQGMINVFVWHLRDPYHGEEFLTQNMSDFQKYNAFKSILPGGSNHDYFKTKLQKVADVSNHLIGTDGKKIPIIFRPFHEFDGDWFWWGKPYSSDEEFKILWRFMVTYLRDELNVDNMLFAYSPDSRLLSESNYLRRYPGDDYVDILGMDNYGDFRDQMQTDFDNANVKLQIISELAKSKVKVAALTEACYFVTPGQNMSVSDFYSKGLHDVITKNDVELAFMMFWSNNNEAYCVPTPNQSGITDFLDFIRKDDILLNNNLPNLYILP